MHLDKTNQKIALHLKPSDDVAMTIVGSDVSVSWSSAHRRLWNHAARCFCAPCCWKTLQLSCATHSL